MTVKKIVSYENCAALPEVFADKNGHLPSACESAGVYIAKNMSEIF